jgi:hypothetical protein
MKIIAIVPPDRFFGWKSCKFQIYDVTYMAVDCYFLSAPEDRPPININNPKILTLR